jgi:hypothetical protein
MRPPGMRWAVAIPLARPDVGPPLGAPGLVPGMVDMTTWLIGALSASASITAAITYLIREGMWFRFARWLMTQFKDHPEGIKAAVAVELLRARRGKASPADPWLLALIDRTESLGAESAANSEDAAMPTDPVDNPKGSQEQAA